MKLIKRTTYNPTLPTFFDDFLSRDFFGQNRDLSSLRNTPAVNILETDDNYAIELAAPGLTREDFNIELEDHLLTISFEKKNEETEDKGRFTRREFNYTSFRRTFTIPENAVDAEKIDARYEGGILKLTLPKVEEVKTKPKRTISIG